MLRNANPARVVSRIKADLLCWGLYPNDVTKEILSRQNPCHDQKTGNFGIHIAFSNASHILVTVAHSFDYKSPYHIERRNGDLVLVKKHEDICDVREARTPKWYAKYTTTGHPMPSIFLHEGRKFLHQAYSGCDYHREQIGCRFCGAGSQWFIGTPKEVSEVAEKALREDGAYHVCLGGGTRLPQERNFEYFLDCAMRIRKHTPSCPIWVEMVPPPPSQITDLVNAGVTSFGFNIEVWEDRLRKEVCPGKGLIEKKEFLSRVEKAVSLLGPNRVGSCLIVGIEPIESTIQGIQNLCSIGIQPCLLPFHPWDKSAYENANPCNPEDLMAVSDTAVQSMKANDLNPNLNQGCLGCEGCTIDHDLYGLEFH